MGIPLESAKSSSDNNFDEPRLPNTAGKSANRNPVLRQNKAKKNLADSLQILLAIT